MGKAFNNIQSFIPSNSSIHEHHLRSQNFFVRNIHQYKDALLNLNQHLFLYAFLALFIVLLLFTLFIVCIIIT